MALSSLGACFRSTDKKIDSMLDTADGTTIYIGDRKTISLVKRVLALIIGCIIVVLFWWAVAEIYNQYFSYSLSFPTPAEVFLELGTLFDGKTLFRYSVYDHIEASLLRWVKGFTIAAIIGIIIGLLISLNDWTYEIGIVPITILQMIPGLAWLPVVMILFGFGDTSAIFIVGIVVISPVALSVSSGLRSVPKVNRRVAKMSGLSKLDTVIEVLLPFAILDILNGLRIGLGSSWLMIIAAEMVVGVTT
ncbi:MAG TPA: ABC transporter permease subunit, partial [Clostridiaceae bacterium]|nr:ABC transporter permease subunit [Clostridiaceae bacterium]